MNRSEDQLSAHIRSVFEELDHEGADQGWQELRKKFPEKQDRKIAYLWFSGIAASLLMLALLLFQHGETNQKPAHKVVVRPHVPLQNKMPTQGRLPEANVLAAAREAAGITKKRTSGANPEINTAARVDSIVVPVKSPSDNLNPIAIHTDFRQQKADSLKKKTSLQDFLEQESKLALKAESSTNKKEGLHTSFDIFTATVFNYYANNPVKVNMGGGINANLRLNPQFAISIGAGIAETSISYSNTKPSAVKEQILLPGENGYGQAKIPEISASLLSIDVPIALKFYPGRKKNYYFSGGINSSTYLNQKYQATYTYVPINGDGRPLTNTKSEELRFQGFDFAHSAILAVGISRPIGKSNHIIFEPFFRPSLRDLGKNNLKINTAGLTVRLNLSSPK